MVNVDGIIHWKNVLIKVTHFNMSNFQRLIIIYYHYNFLNDHFYRKVPDEADLRSSGHRALVVENESGNDLKDSMFTSNHSLGNLISSITKLLTVIHLVSHIEV